MVQTPDGELIMFVMKARRAGREHPEQHVQPTRSRDNGHTWGPLGPELRLFDGWSEPNTSGCMQVLTDGTWMMPAYGADAVGGATYPIVAFSDDDGRTWGQRSAIAISDSSTTFYEPAVIQLRDGWFLAVIRTQTPPFTSYRAYSQDEGLTWTRPEPLPFQGQTPFLFELGSGSVLCVYRDRDPALPGVSAGVSRDGGTAWEGVGRLYEAPGLELRLPIGRTPAKRPPTLCLLHLVRCERQL